MSQQKLPTMFTKSNKTNRSPTICASDTLAPFVVAAASVRPSAAELDVPVAPEAVVAATPSGLISMLTLVQPASSQ